MGKRNLRLDAIRDIISQRNIGSQEALQRALAVRGFGITQATLSRDLKQLRVVKATGPDGRHIYALPPMPQHPTAYERGSGFVSLRFSGNMAVVRTLPGHAASLAYRIDSDAHDDILGTIAGDDTIFIAMAETASHKGIAEHLQRIIPDMH